MQISFIPDDFDPLDMSDDEFQVGTDQPTFNGEEVDQDYGFLADDELLDNEDPEFIDSTLDLETLEIEPQDEDTPEAVVTDPNLAIDMFARHLTRNPSLVSFLKKGVTEGKLDMLSEATNADLTGLYKTNTRVNIFINAVARGLIVSEKFENTIPNTVKIFYVPQARRDSVHLHKTSAGINTYKSTPAILKFNQNTVNELQALYKDRILGFDSLYSYLYDSCYVPFEVESDEGEKQAYLAQDNLTIAQSLARSRLRLSEGMKRLSSIGMTSTRANKIAVLAKAIRDNRS